MTQDRRIVTTGRLDRELRSTLEALDELGPTYEPELAAALVQRLREHGYVPGSRGGDEGQPNRHTPSLPLIAAAALAAFILFSAAARPHSGHWAYRYHREWNSRPGNEMIVPAPAPPVVPAAPAAPAPPGLPPPPSVQ